MSKNRLNKELDKKEERQVGHFIDERTNAVDAEISRLESRLQSSATGIDLDSIKSGMIGKSSQEVLSLESRALFSRLKHKMDDADINSKDLITQFSIHDSTAQLGSAVIDTPLSKLTNYMQIDLLMGVKPDEQLLLLKKYAVADGEDSINMSSLLDDLAKQYPDWWATGLGTGVNANANAEANEARLKKAEDEERRRQLAMQSVGEVPSQYQTLVAQANDNANALSDMHALIHAEKDEMKMGDSAMSTAQMHATTDKQQNPMSMESLITTKSAYDLAANSNALQHSGATSNSFEGNGNTLGSTSSSTQKRVTIDPNLVQAGYDYLTSDPGAGDQSLPPTAEGGTMDIKSYAQNMPGPTASESPRTSAPLPTTAPTRDIPGNTTSTNNSSSSTGLSDKEMNILRENERLKSELGKFDSGFFEELEDLKHRYITLQKLVGPEALDQANSFLSAGAGPGHPKGAFSQSLPGPAKGGRPLDSTSWSEPPANRVMDNVSLNDNMMVGGRYRYSENEAPQDMNILGVAKTAFVTPPSIDAKRDGISTSSTAKPAGSDLDTAAPILRHSTGQFPAGTLYQGVESNPRFIAQDIMSRGGTAQNSRTSGNTSGGSVASMCERRLLFELGNHPNPEHAARTLVSRLVDMARKYGNDGVYISLDQICKCLAGCGLKMDRKEVHVFASGFASDGSGGVDVEELCEALQAVLFNFIGEHEATLRSKAQGVTQMMDAEAMEKKLKEYMKYLAGSLLNHDKKGILGSGVSVYDTLVEPFNSADNGDTGVLPYERFSRVLRALGIMLDAEDSKIVLQYFNAKSPNTNVHNRDAGGGAFGESKDAVSGFQNKQMHGTLSGAMKSDPAFADFMVNNHIGQGLESSVGEQFVEYEAFVHKLTEAVGSVIAAKKAGVDKYGVGVLGSMYTTEASEEAELAKQGQWVIKEFALVEQLICQLELMKPAAKRRCLISLQYSLLTGDINSSGEIDGFTLVSGLLNAGFQLQRLNRVQLLKAVEELGGKLEYDELFQILLRSCSDWTRDERTLVHKVLRAMGVTVQERRAWLGRCKAALRIAALEYNAAISAQAQANGEALAEEDTENVDADLGIPPSAFLHILRDHGCHLNVEQEACLLDCLDTERLAAQGLSRMTGKETYKNTTEIKYKQALKSQTNQWEMPLVYFKAFLSMCARHAGDWTDAVPEVADNVFRAVKNAHDPMKGILELHTLFNAFDESKAGTVGNRAFKIVCHRARIFANVEENDISALADTLTSEGGGKVKYATFVYLLKNYVDEIITENNKAMLEIGGQLLENATDKNNTLLALRTWLLHHTDTESCVMTIKQFTACLREFSVLYRTADVKDLFLEIGSWVTQEAKQRAAEVEAAKGTGRLHGTAPFSKSGIDASMSKGTNTNASVFNQAFDQAMHGYDSIDQRILLEGNANYPNNPNYTYGNMRGATSNNGTEPIITTQQLLDYLLTLRGHWTRKHPQLCVRLTRSMAALGISTFVTNANDSNKDKASSAGELNFGFPKGPKGLETATARRILARLKAYTGSPQAELSDQSTEKQKEDKMVDLDVFGAICRATGLKLSDEELLILADATDRHPLANRISIDVLLESIAATLQNSNKDTTATSNGGEEAAKASSGGNPFKKKEYTKAQTFALKHLKDVLWDTGQRMKRTARQWRNDVMSLFTGFDGSKVGYITTEDFQMALTLLNSSVDQAIVSDLPTVPEGPGMVNYSEILDHVLKFPPTAFDMVDESGKTIPKTKAGKKSQNAGKTAPGPRDGKYKAGTTNTLGKGGKKAADDDEGMTVDELMTEHKKVEAVQQLVRVIRKSMKRSIKTAGAGKHTGPVTGEELKAKLQKAFFQFDQEDKGKVAPRDFCLAVSILLDRDEILMTESQWAQIIEYFCKSDKSKQKQAEERLESEDTISTAFPMVDYLAFLSMVLFEEEDAALTRKSGRKK